MLQKWEIKSRMNGALIRGERSTRQAYAERKRHKEVSVHKLGGGDRE